MSSNGLAGRTPSEPSFKASFSISPLTSSRLSGAAESYFLYKCNRLYWSFVNSGRLAQSKAFWLEAGWSAAITQTETNRAARHDEKRILVVFICTIRRGSLEFAPGRRAAAGWEKVRAGRGEPQLNGTKE